MAEPSTIDIQKVYNSATEKFKSFIGAVDSPLSSSSSSSSKAIYQNIVKLFDVFTKGVLSNQGANSEQVLRMVYKSMNSGFLDVLNNSEVVDNIVQLMKQRQDSVNESNASTANVSDTTKKVALNQLSPDNVDLTSVMMDFAADLQTSILQTRLNLTREYERQKLAYAKSQAGQKEDLDRLNRESIAQNKEVAESVSQMSEDDRAWREAQLKKLEDILAGFKSIDNTCSQDKFKEIDGIIDSTEIGSGYDPYRLMKEISAIGQQAMKNIKVVQTPMAQKDVSTSGSPLHPSQIHQAAGDGKDVQPPIVSRGHDADGAVGQGQQTPEIPTQGTKISVSPINNREITRIIRQESGEKQTMNAPPASGPVPSGALQPPQDSDSGKDTKISEEGVISTLNKIHGNVQSTLRDQKFSSRFTLQYASIQKEIGKQLSGMDKSEESISSDLKTTEKGIKKSRKGRGLIQTMMNLGFGFLNMVWIAIGGLVIITLVRMALSKWKKTYMPPSDGRSTLTIFGVKIPGWSGIKSLMVGVRNFMLVGIPNLWTKISAFTSKAFSSLFGPKGVIRDMGRARAAIIRIAVAWITGQTKKAGGTVVKWILKIIGWAFAWIPGVNPVCNFLAAFGPHLYAYIMTQITGVAANAAAEKSARERKFVQNGDLRSRDAAEKYKQKIIAMARGVKPFKVQKANIPGLQTPKIEDNPRPGSRSAIMRRVPTKYSTNAEKVSHEIADFSFEREKKANASADKARINEKGSVFSKMASAGQRIFDKAAAEKGAKGTFYQQWASSRALQRKYGYFWPNAAKNRNKEIQKEIMDGSVSPEIRKVDQYIAILSKSKRFQGVKGPLYHPIYGWNPGYRVYAGDLMSAIPLTPFESIHQKRDVPIGVPAGPEKDSIGYMPFTWIQDNSRISAHPLKFELERASAIRKIYEWTAGQVTNIGKWWTGDTHFDIEDFKKKVLPKAFDMWRSWSRVMGEKIGFGYQDKNHIIFGNKFAEFINRWRQGGMDESENTMESVDRKKYWERVKSTPTWLKVAAAVTAPMGGAMLLLLKPIADDAIKAVSKFAVQAASNIKKTITRTISYDKSEKAKGDGTFWGNLKAGAKNVFKAAKSAARLAWWRLKSFNGVRYGNVRDFMIDGGVIDLFRGGTVANPIAKAMPLLRELVRMGVIAKYGSASHEDMPMVSLIKGYFDRVNIRGFDWRQLAGDRPALAGFAQTFLSYLAFKVLRRWNISEQLLSAFFTNATDRNKKALIAGLESLHSLFSQNMLFDFMARYLRFPNLRVNVIDYSNARGAQFWMLDKYRKAMGIPTRKERQEIRERIRRRMSRGDRKVGILEMMLALEGKGVSAFADDAKELKWIQDKIDKVAFEARHTGDKTFLIELLRYRDWLMDRIRQKQAMKNGLVVQKPSAVAGGHIPQLVPAKSKEEQEKEDQERKAKEAEERRKKEEEDRKRLAEEAKRKQALVIAQAKIKAMEAIRKQEQKYESLLERMVQDPSKVAESELKSLGEDVANLKQEAENRIAQLPREQREMKLALIRGDKISAKTFKEMKDTAVGLHGNLQSYMEEVKKMPVGSIVSINSQSSSAQPVYMQDSDAVDLAS